MLQRVRIRPHMGPSGEIIYLEHLSRVLVVEDDREPSSIDGVFIYGGGDAETSKTQETSKDYSARRDGFPLEEVSGLPQGTQEAAKVEQAPDHGDL